MKKKLTFFFTLIILFCLYIFLLSVNYAKSISANLSSSVFRLHIIANSDSVEDQQLKLLIRDDIISYMSTLVSTTSTKSDVNRLISDHLEDFKNIALETIHSNGYNYDVNISIGNFYFPTKSYANVSFPSGYYDALKIEIGEAIGQNWWCVLFPPLCFVNSSSGVLPEDSKVILKENLNSESYNIINSTNEEQNTDNSIKIKFKIVELFNNL